jgi:hypothetical protein
MPEKFSNNAQTTLTAAITSGAATSLTVASATAFPSSGNFRILIDSEIMLVTGVSGTTWTVTRAVEAVAGVTAAATHANGATVTHMLTAGALAAAAIGGAFPGDLNWGGAGPSLPSLGTSPSLGTGRILIQAGSTAAITDAGAGLTITFPFPFPNGLLSVVGCNGDHINRPNSLVEVYLATTNLSQVNFTNYQAGTLLVSTTVRINWIAIGY